MTVEGEGGYVKNVKKKYNKAFREFEDEVVPNANVRRAFIIAPAGDPYGSDAVPVADAGQTYMTVVTVAVAAGQQLRLLKLRFYAWTEANAIDDDAILQIFQTGGTAHGLPAGNVDYVTIFLTPITGTYEVPVHILEGSVAFRILNVQANHRYILSYWGDENSPQIVYEE